MIARLPTCSEVFLDFFASLGFFGVLEPIARLIFILVCPTEDTSSMGGETHGHPRLNHAKNKIVGRITPFSASNA